MEDVVDDPTELWTEAPVESDSDEEDAEQRAALAGREESDIEEADDSEPVVGMQEVLDRRSKYLCRKIRILRLYARIFEPLRAS